MWDIFPNVYGQSLTLTTAQDDIYNNLPIASSLKSTIEFNHTTLLGCVTGAFKQEWYRMHRNKNLTEIQTRDNMRYYLNKYFNNINGMNSILMNMKNKITVFNQMTHAWRKMIEILIALPACVNWFGNLCLLNSLIRITGCLFNVQNEQQRQHIQSRMIPILTESLVIYYFMSV